MVLKIYFETVSDFLKLSLNLFLFYCARIDTFLKTVFDERNLKVIVVKNVTEKKYLVMF